MYVNYCGIHSRVMDIEYGVPQGSVLGSFCLYFTSMIYHNVYITMIIYKCLKLRSQTLSLSLWSPGMCMSCIFLFCFLSAYACTYVYI